MTDNITGAEIVLKSLTEQGVEVVFGYPGGAVLPIYDSLFKQNSIKGFLSSVPSAIILSTICIGALTIQSSIMIEFLILHFSK